MLLSKNEMNKTANEVTQLYVQILLLQRKVFCLTIKVKLSVHAVFFMLIVICDLLDNIADR